MNFKQDYPIVSLDYDAMIRAIGRRRRRQRLSRAWSALWPLLSIIFGVLVIVWGIS